MHFLSSLLCGFSIIIPLSCSPSALKATDQQQDDSYQAPVQQLNSSVSRDKHESVAAVKVLRKLLNKGIQKRKAPEMISDKDNKDILSPIGKKKRIDNSLNSSIQSDQSTLNILPPEILFEILRHCDYKTFYQARLACKTLRAISEPDKGTSLYLPEKQEIITWINKFHTKDPIDSYDIDGLLKEFKMKNAHTENSYERLYWAFNSYLSLVPTEDSLCIDSPLSLRNDINVLDETEIKRRLILWRPYGIALWLSYLISNPGLLHEIFIVLTAQPDTLKILCPNYFFGLLFQVRAEKQ